MLIPDRVKQTFEYETINDEIKIVRRLIENSYLKKSTTWYFKGICLAKEQWQKTSVLYISMTFPRSFLSGLIVICSHFFYFFCVVLVFLSRDVL